MDVPPYIPVPPSAAVIRPPDEWGTYGASSGEASGSGTTSASAAASASPSRAGAGARPTPAPFPPPTAAPPPRKLMPSIPTGSLSTNVSDLVLSSILPPNLPRVSSTHARHGKVKPLTSQSEGLGLNVMSNNFVRFVTKVGPVFWFQDRVEEVLFWHKPMWTWAWMATWTFMCFVPRAILCIPSALLLIVFINLQESKRPLPSILGGAVEPAPAAGSERIPTTDGGYSASTAPDSEGAPVVPPKEAESSVDYFMNIQAIQNLMGTIVDAFDAVVPILTLIGGKDTSPTSFPLSATHVVLLFLLPTLFLPLTPGWAIPYLLLPAGIIPPLFFHPNLNSLIVGLPATREARAVRARLEDLALTDGLSDSVGRAPRSRVEVWENERLDPAFTSKPANTPLPPGTWAARFLRTGERAHWTKMRGADSLWADEDTKAKQASDEFVLALKPGWAFVPGEDWRTDVCALWSDVGADSDGWAYSDDNWEHSAPVPIGPSPAALVPARRVTRRRRWYRRVYLEGDGAGEKQDA